MMKFRSLVAVATCGTALSLSGVAQAQQAQPAQQPRPTQPGVQVEVGRTNAHSADQINDHAIASCLAIGNQEEIALAKFAEDKAHSRKVKDFASMLEKDHREFLKKLEKYAPEASKDGYLMERSASNDGQTRNTNRVDAAGNNVAVTKNENRDNNDNRDNRSDHADWKATSMLQLHREIAQECLSESKEMLSKKDGAKFDECFIGGQVAKHAGMKAKLTVFKRHVSGDLQKLVAEGLDTTERHLKKAEEIMKQLHDTSTADANK